MILYKHLQQLVTFAATASRSSEDKDTSFAEITPLKDQFKSAINAIEILADTNNHLKDDSTKINNDAAQELERI